MEQWINAHPICFTVLAFPVVCFACLLIAAFCGLDIERR